MSDILELLFNLLEAVVELWLGDFSWPDTTLGRLCLGALIVFLAGLIWWELR
jgi:hypothetical protein